MGHSLHFSVVLIVLALAACGGTTTGALSNMFETKEVRAARLAQEDDAKCKSLGFKPGTEPYGNCRLQLEQIRATKAAADAADNAAIQARRARQSATPQASLPPLTDTTHIDATSGRMVHCSGPANMQTCF